MSDYEAVIGLEVHVQLLTGHKLFCAAPAEFGAAPNTHVDPVTLGLPGALPVLNKEAVGLAVRAALALGCEVQERSVFARKNYFYPDLPKGYQISQFEEPLATGGGIEVPAEQDAGPARVRLHRLHLEEDAGKSLHDRFERATAVDLNRAGVPLVEIVSEPDLRSPAQARAYLQELKRILEYVEVSDCNMEEGSLRVDANISIRPRGSSTLHTKTEIKNLNSFSNMEKALDLEIQRQIELVEAGGVVEHTTLTYDDARGTIRAMRSKEESHDYRYFPDPDLLPLRLTLEEIATTARELPELPAARRARFETSYGLPEYDAEVLTATRSLADFFEAVVEHAPDSKAASNWVMGPLLAEANERGVTPETLPVSAERLAELIRLVEEGRVSHSIGKRVLARMIETGRAASEIVDAEGLGKITDPEALATWVDLVLTEHPEEVERYRAGEARLLGFFVGQVMRRSGGKADPKEVNRLLREGLGA